MTYIIPLSFVVFLTACQSSSALDQHLNAPTTADPTGFQNRGDNFAVNVAGHAATLDADGLHFDNTLTLQLSRWGREGNTLGVSAATVQWGDCTANARWLSDGSCARSVHLSRPGLTEYWQPVHRGLEQGWTIAQRPTGDGDLQLHVSFEHAAQWRIDPTGQRAQIVAGDGRHWSYAGLKVWDAQGVHLRAWMARSERGVQLIVDDSRATYPVTIDPILSADVALAPLDPAAHTIFANPISYGASVTGAGDVNADGFNDLLVGAPGWDVLPRSDPGAGHLYLGSSTGIDATAPIDVLALNRFHMGSVATSASGGGDLNGDGFDDVVLGAPAANVGGLAHVFYGSASGLDISVENIVEGSDTWVRDEFGYAVSIVGDVNNDGFDDILVSAPGNEDDGPESGSVYLYLGSALGIDPSTELKLTASDATANHYYGVALSGAGDVNGDGFDDIIIGTDRDSANGPNAGAAYLYYGGPTGIDPATEFKLTASDGSPYDLFGHAVANAGDVNADGFDDILVGAYGDSDTPDAGGSAYVYYGSSTGVSSQFASKIQGSNTQRGDAFGIAVSGAFDSNNDGFDDIVVGAPEADHFGSQSGSVYVYFGSAAGISAATEQHLSSPDATPGDLLGSAVAGVADVDGDGFDDVLAGGPGRDIDAVQDAGSAMLFHGSCDQVWYLDADQDGHGNPTVSLQDCVQPAGYVLDNTDCDDINPSVNPAQVEVCDGSQVDEDCSGQADDDDPAVVSATAWYADADLDGFGDAHAVSHLCIAPQGYLPDFGDCDDTDATAFPGAIELCDGQLNDCDSAMSPDEADEDEDGYIICTLDLGGWDGPGIISGGEDCNDTNASITPNQTDVAGDGIDSDCDGWGGPTDDEDGDGLSWADEQAAGTSDSNPDADSDGLNDGDEVSVYNTNPLSNDSDADGLLDFEEIYNTGTNPNEADSDFDGLTDLDEQSIGTNPNSADTDADGLNDGDEVDFGSNPFITDSDIDGLDDAEEHALGTHPNNPDTDADGLLDGEDDDPLVALASTPTTPKPNPTSNPGKSSGCSVIVATPGAPLGALTILGLLSIRRRRRFVPN